MAPRPKYPLSLAPQSQASSIMDAPSSGASSVGAMYDSTAAHTAVAEPVPWQLSKKEYEDALTESIISVRRRMPEYAHPDYNFLRPRFDMYVANIQVMSYAWRMPARAALHMFGFPLAFIPAIMDDLDDEEACRARYHVAKLARETRRNFPTALRWVLRARVQGWRLEWEGARPPRRAKKEAINLRRPNWIGGRCTARDVQRAVSMLEVDLIKRAYDEADEEERERCLDDMKEAAVHAEEKLKELLKEGLKEGTDTPFATQVAQALEEARRWGAQRKKSEEEDKGMIKKWEKKLQETKPTEVNATGERATEVKANEKKRDEGKAADETRIEFKTIEVKTAGVETVEMKTMEDQSTEDESTEAKSAENKPDEDKPPEDKPNEPKSTEHKPGEGQTVNDKREAKKAKENERKKKNKAKKKGKQRAAAEEARLLSEAAEEDKANIAAEVLKKLENIAPNITSSILAAERDKLTVAEQALNEENANIADEILDILDKISPDQAPSVFAAVRDKDIVTDEMLRELDKIAPNFAFRVMGVLKSKVMGARNVVDKWDESSIDIATAVFAAVNEKVKAAQKVAEKRDGVSADMAVKFFPFLKGKANITEEMLKELDKIDKIIPHELAAGALKSTEQGIAEEVPEKKDNASTDTASSVLGGIKQLASCCVKRAKSRSPPTTKPTEGMSPVQEQNGTTSAIEEQQQKKKKKKKKKKAVGKSDSHQGLDAAEPKSTPCEEEDVNGREKPEEDKVTVADIMAAADELGDPSLTETPPTRFCVNTWISKLLSSQNLSRPSPPLNLGSFGPEPNMTFRARQLLDVPAKVHLHFYTLQTKKEHFYDLIINYMSVEAVWRDYLVSCEETGNKPLARGAWETRTGLCLETKVFCVAPTDAMRPIEWEYVRDCINMVYCEWGDILEAELLRTWKELARFGADDVYIETG